MLSYLVEVSAAAIFGDDADDISSEEEKEDRVESEKETQRSEEDEERHHSEYETEQRQVEEACSSCVFFEKFQI